MFLLFFGRNHFQFHPSAMNVNELKFITQRLRQEGEHSDHSNDYQWMWAARQMEVFVLGKCVIRT